MRPTRPRRRSSSARKALAPDANAVASLDALARDLGLGDAN